MPRPRLGTIVLGLSVAMATAACDGYGGGDQVQPTPLPSGSLGVVTPQAGDEAFRGLCELQGATEVEEANATFFDRSHETLHVIAAATEVVDRQRAAALLVAKQRIEAALKEPALPPGFAGDVERLLGATAAALRTIGLEPAECGA
jgi:hypothetical protein